MQGLKSAARNLFRALLCRARFYRFNRSMMLLFADAAGAYNEESSCAAGQAFFFKKYAGGFRAPVLDVGANRGDYALELSKYVRPEVPVFCLEPHPATFLKLKENLSGDPRYRAFNLAAGERNGSVFIYDGKGAGGSTLASLYEGVITSLHGLEPEKHETEMLRLDDFCAREGIDSVSLLKLDVEGGELGVLKGFSGYLSAGKVEFINFEFHAMNVVSRSFFRDFWVLLSPRYRFYRLIPGGMIEIGAYEPFYCELFGYQNLLAVLRG